MSRSSPSASTLERTFERMPTFLRAIALYPLISGAMAARGLTRADIQEGWDLLHRSMGLDTMPEVIIVESPARLAIAEIDGRDEDIFRLITSALRRRHRDQYDYVTEGLQAGSGAEAVLGMRRLLERLDALEHAPERAATREADHAALATLATRGITPAERTHLWQLVTTAQSPAPAPAPTVNREAAEAARQQALLDLHAWYEEWADVARAVIKKHQLLIYLGLASPRSERA